MKKGLNTIILTLTSTESIIMFMNPPINTPTMSKNKPMPNTTYFLVLGEQLMANIL